MKIVLTGGTGFIGKRLVEVLRGEDNEIILLSRSTPTSADKTQARVKVVQWDASTQGNWSKEIDGADAVINLAGESIGAKRWTPKQRRRIVESRVGSTRALIEAMRNASKKPPVMISSSAVGFYGSVPSGAVTETHPQGEGFLAQVCGQWEAEAIAAESLGVRVVRLRTAVVLDKEGGALQRMVLPFRFFLGAPLGNGKQWFPWIHRDDFAGVVHFVLKNPSISGAVNVAAPDTVTMNEFCRQLAAVLHRPCLPIGIPASVLRAMLGEMSSMLLTGQQVVPSKLLAAGYTFRFPKLSDALRTIFA